MQLATTRHAPPTVLGGVGGAAGDAAGALGALGPGHIAMLDGIGAGVVHAGIDLVDVERFRLAVARSGPGLLRRVLSDDEQLWVHRTDDPVGAAAAAFGVKEAVIKAAGGMPRGGRFRDVSTPPLPAGPVPVSLQGQLLVWARDERLDLVAGSFALSDALTLSWVVATHATTERTAGPGVRHPAPAWEELG
jgi:phosphopantetheine--protein transferase-like protein